MVSFRKKVLDALDIKKDFVRLPCYQTFRVPAEDSLPQIDPSTNSTCSDLKPYAISKPVRRLIIGPQNRSERIEVLGFVVGDDPGSNIMLPDCLDRDAIGPYTGMHYLGGLYDSSNIKLRGMRKSGVDPLDLETHYDPLAGNNSGIPVTDHTHSDWPSLASEQAVLLNSDPYADSLYYHSTKIRFILTGIDDVEEQSASSGVSASNHRGTVRMLVLRPRVPTVRTRVDGSSNEFILNYGYMPNWDTQLFYDNDKQLGGKLDPDSEAHTVAANTGGSTIHPLRPHVDSKFSSESVTYGLTKAELPNPVVDQTVSSVHYGHMAPTAGKEHQLTPTDLLMSKVNLKKYAVLHDEVFTLDSLHHGAASQHVVNVNIPYNKKVRFSGRKPILDSENQPTDILSHHTFDEPINLETRPIVLFLSYNQKISASVQGHTVISEV